MKPTIDHNQARQLLKLWYNATITPDQEASLWDYFTTTIDIPADLRAEAIMFGHTDSPYIPASTAPTVDEALQSEVAEVIRAEANASDTNYDDLPEAVRDTPRFITRLRRYIPYAACTAAAIALAIVVFRSDDSQTSTVSPQPSTTIAQNTPTEQPVQSINSTDTTTSHAGNVLPIPTPQKVNMSRAASTSLPSTPPPAVLADNTDDQSISEDGYIIIESPDQVNQILLASLTKIEHTFGQSTTSVNEATQTMARSISTPATTINSSIQKVASASQPLFEII